MNHEGDLFRTRLTHSLEVAQLGRSIARNLQLNEDLTEAIALAHDLGHTPFGHAGQDALNACLKAGSATSAGFEHNLQSLRVVDSLELCYPTYDGLNLTFETREGILKHCSHRNAQRIELREPQGIAQRFLRGSESPFAFQQPGLEAQLANLADEIAYNAHDIDDGVRSGLLDMEQLEEVSLFDFYKRASLHEHPGLRGRRLLFDTIRRMLSAQVYDVSDATQAALRAAAPADADAVRHMQPLVSFSPEMAQQTRQLKQFLLHKLYRHPQVLRTTAAAQQVVRDLFQAYSSDHSEMTSASADVRSNVQMIATGAPRTQMRIVADYIAGMTDRFAIKEHVRLTGTLIFPH